MKIPSYERKVNRAERHFREVERIVDNYSQLRSYTIAHRTEGNENMHVYRLKVLRQPPPRLPLIVGDLVHNLRSALDHVASNVSKDRGSSFPLSERDLWPDDPSTVVDQERLKRELAQWERLIKGLEDDAIAMFKKHMPGQNRPATSEYFNGLGALAYLSNADKHRELVVLKGVLENPVMTIGEFGIKSRQPLSGVFEDNAVIFSHTREMQVEIRGPSAVLVGVRGGKDVGLVRYLQIMLNHIRDEVIPDFVPFMRGDG
jgi:hypothetical protein